DREVLESINISEGENPKDILFDVLMTRFEAAQPYKPIFKEFWQNWIFTPECAPPLLLQGFSSMTWMLEAASIDTQGVKGMLRIQGFTTLYLLALRVWLSDDSPELGKTMAFLDKGLSRLEKMAGFLNIVEI
ncbi:MAG TPA: TetR/AcrR family transcriptional regulator, partial [Bdellovibrionota bacterium]|nr:TetR/AcrR family transcriptional regulator [Bdellovibrionota bacterium]